MNQRTKYKTKQREILLGYLQALSGRHVTAADVCAYCAEQGAAISQATVYRQLESLVDEGLVHKYIIDGGSPACFEYAGPESPAAGCFHCKCEKCGRLIHLSCPELEGVREHLESRHQFRLDPLRTVFYGLCDQCR